MKILFTGLYPLYHYHFVSELNLIENHLESGDEVYLLECNASLYSCECNKNHDLAHCLRCIGIRQHGVSLLSDKINKVSVPDSKKYLSEAELLLKRVHSLEDLKKLKVGNFDLGMAVFSSLVDHTKTTIPEPKLWIKKIQTLTCDALAIYSLTRSLIKQHGLDLVYVFNGRYATARAVVRACQAEGTEFYTHERNSTLNRIQLFKNTFPHDPRPYARLVKEYWESSKDIPEIVKEGIDFFEERPRGKLSGWISMIDKQLNGKIPDSWDSNKTNIVIFGSTEGEFVALQDLYEGSLFSTQLEAYSSLLTAAEKNCPGIFFYLRLHPNSKNESFQWWNDPQIKKFKHLEIIEPEDEVCSYTLLNACEKAIGIGSSMCIEATYWNKPSILLGLTFFSGLDAVYECKSIIEACELLNRRNLPPKPRENAIKFGSFMRCAGEKLKYAEPLNYYTLKFKGEILEARQDVHEWIGESENRKILKGFKKWYQGRRDEKRFHQIIMNCGGNLAASSALK